MPSLVVHDRHRVDMSHRAVVHRGERSDTESSSEDAECVDRAPVDARARSTPAATAVGTNDSSKAIATTTDADDDARATGDGADARARVHGDVLARDGARDGGTIAPGTRMTTRASAWTRDAPLARAVAVTAARERELTILSHTSASIASVGGHAREAALNTREAAGATARLVATRRET